MLRWRSVDRSPINPALSHAPNYWQAASTRGWAVCPIAPSTPVGRRTNTPVRRLIVANTWHVNSTLHRLAVVAIAVNIVARQTHHRRYLRELRATVIASYKLIFRVSKPDWSIRDSVDVVGCGSGCESVPDSRRYTATRSNCIIARRLEMHGHGRPMMTT